MAVSASRAISAVAELFVVLLLFARQNGAKCVQLGCFHRRSIFLHSNFTWTGLSPITHSWHQKTRDSGLPDGEDRILLRSPVLTPYRSVTDGRTDGRIFRGIYSACKASFATRCKNLPLGSAVAGVMLPRASMQVLASTSVRPQHTSQRISHVHVD